MTEEKEKILDKIYDQLQTKKKKLMSKMVEYPNVHRIDDGIIIRFFVDWDNCADDQEIKFKKLDSIDNPDESVVFFYIPKGAKFRLRERFYIGCMTCLNGKMEVSVGDETKIVEGYTKVCIESDMVDGLALENTYLLTTSNRADWSDETHKHIEKNY